MSKLSGLLGVLSVLLLLLIIASAAFAGAAWWQQRDVRAAYEQELLLAESVLQAVPMPWPAWNMQRVENLWSDAGILEIRFPTLLHHLDGNNELVLIAAMLSEREGLTVTGRWFEKDTECCVNRAEYERLLADPDSGFSGFGDAVTYREPNAWGAEAQHLVENNYKTLTVVGIVEEEGVWEDEALYGSRHVYLSMNALSAYFIGYNYTSSQDGLTRERLSIAYSNFDLDAYQPYRLYRDAVRYIRRTEDGASVELMTGTGKKLTEEEVLDIFSHAVVNVGFTIEIQFDTPEAMQKYVQKSWDQYFMRSKPISAKANNERTGLDDRLIAQGEGDEWYTVRLNVNSNPLQNAPLHLIQYAPKDPAPIKAAYAPSFRIYHLKLIGAAAVCALSLVGILLCETRRRRILKEARYHV